MPIILAGDEAFDKWRHGKDAWNAWVEENPVADVSFADVDFSLDVSQKITSFRGFKFPNGLVDFSGARFGKGLVSFSGARFGKGYVDFARADFGDGGVDFASAIFGDGDVDFLGASFGEGEVKFEDITFHGKANFSRLKNCEAVKRFSFRNVSFEKTFMISGEFECVVDMVGTRTGHHVDLSGLTCHLQREGPWYFRKAKKPEGADRLRRLKELAENNKHHEAALRFHADEMRAKRWHKTGRLASILDMLFSATSNYGQSILRPFLGLVVLTLILTFWEFMSSPREKDAGTSESEPQQKKEPFDAVDIYLEQLKEDKERRLFPDEELEGEPPAPLFPQSESSESEPQQKKEPFDAVDIYLEQLHQRNQDRAYQSVAEPPAEGEPPPADINQIYEIARQTGASPETVARDPEGVMRQKAESDLKSALAQAPGLVKEMNKPDGAPDQIPGFDKGLVLEDIRSLSFLERLAKDVTSIRDILFFLPASRTGDSSVIYILCQFFAFIFIFLIGLGLRNRFRI